MMTTEEKAKCYDLAIETAKCIYNNMKEGGNFGGMEDLEEIFPELRESEDDRIRKQIIYAIKELHVCDETKRKCVAWLEKQDKKIDAIENFDTEFEKQISRLIASIINKDYKYTKDFVKWTSNALLNYAKYEIEKQGEQILANSAKTCKDEQKLTENKDYSAPFDIEIPFGAKDSELIQETIRIPDGCYASIEGNEIVIKKGQKSAEWSEEGEMIYQHCKTILHDYGYDNWLKSLKERYIWKPTDLQIEALESATENCAYSEYQDCLRDLIKQLKQLS